MPSKPTPKKSPPFISRWAVLVLVLLWSLAGCETQPKQPSSALVRSVQAQPLPTWARQPEIPSECLGGCLQKLTAMRESWRTSLTGGTSPAAPASASTTPSAKN